MTYLSSHENRHDFNKFLDKFIVLAEKDLQTTKLLLQKGDCLCKEVIVYMIYCLIPKNALSICDVLLRAVGRSENLRGQVVGLFKSKVLLLF